MRIWGFRVEYFSGLFWEPFGLPLEIWGLRFQATDLLGFFQATDLLGFLGIWGLGFPGKTFWAHSGGFPGKTFWAHSGGFRVWTFRVETFSGFLGFGVQGVRVRPFGLTVQGLGIFWAFLGFTVEGLGIFWAFLGFGVEILRVHDSWACFRFWGFGFQGARLFGLLEAFGFKDKCGHILENPRNAVNTGLFLCSENTYAQSRPCN